MVSSFLLNFDNVAFLIIFFSLCTSSLSTEFVLQIGSGKSSWAWSRSPMFLSLSIFAKLPNFTWFFPDFSGLGGPWIDLLLVIIGPDTGAEICPIVGVGNTMLNPAFRGDESEHFGWIFSGAVRDFGKNLISLSELWASSWFSYTMPGRIWGSSSFIVRLCVGVISGVSKTWMEYLLWRFKWKELLGLAVGRLPEIWIQKISGIL